MIQTNVLKDINAEMVALFLAEIVKQGKVASGQLLESIRPELAFTAGGFELQVIGSTYAIFINKGRAKGTKRVPISALIKWLEITGYANGDRSLMDAAFAIQTAIFKNGIMPAPIIDNTVTQILAQALPRVTKAFKKDVEASIFNSANWRELKAVAS